MNKRTRIETLLPLGEPKYVRCYDNGGKTADRYTVVYTGKYRTIGSKRGGERVNGGFQYVGMSALPFHPQGFGQHGEHTQQIDVNKWGFAPAMGRSNHLGKRIPFNTLPADCQKLVMRDYRTLWNLPEPDPVDALKVKLNPRRFSAMSPKMAAIVGYIIGESWVSPAITGLMVTSDGFLLASRTGDIGYNAFIGAESDLKRNWQDLLTVAGLNNQEGNAAEALYAAKVKHC